MASALFFRSSAARDIVKQITRRTAHGLEETKAVTKFLRHEVSLEVKYYLLRIGNTSGFDVLNQSPELLFERVGHQSP